MYRYYDGPPPPPSPPKKKHKQKNKKTVSNTIVEQGVCPKDTTAEDSSTAPTTAAGTRSNTRTGHVVRKNRLRLPETATPQQKRLLQAGTPSRPTISLDCGAGTFDPPLQ